MKRSVIPSTFLLLGVALVTAAPPKPNFFARRDYTGLNNSRWVQVADTNRDGIPDLIYIGYTVNVLLGNGNGTFRPGPPGSTAPPGSTFTLIAADLNGDGIPDLVAAGSTTGANGVDTFLGNGRGAFTGGAFYPAGSDTGIESVAVGDFNGDHIPDVVTAGSSGIWLFTGIGDRLGTLNPGVLVVPLPMAGNGTLATTDFNGDGNLDLVVTLRAGNKGAGFAVILGNGDGTFQAPQMFSLPNRALGIAVGPLTKGAPPGIALSSLYTTDVYLYFGNGDGTFSGPRRTSLPGTGELAIGDVNGDGIPDLVSDGVYIALGNGNGTFRAPIYYTAYEETNVVLADLRNNGFTDIVTNSSAAISVLLNLGKGKYEEGVWTPVTGGAGCGAAADYNADGKPDLAVNTSQGVTILVGTGKSLAPFTTGAAIPLANAGCPVTGDLNGDGIPDLVVPANGTVVAYLGNGDGTFAYKSTTATPSGGFAVLADFNHNGKLGFATSGNLLAMGNGDGTFQTPVTLVSNPPFDGFQFITTGDLNNDGWPDLVLTSLFDGITYALLNNQQGGFSQITTYGGGAQVALADLNGDGNLDAIIAGSGGAYVFLGNGTGALTYTGDLLDTYLMSAQAPVAIADVNGDGIPDVLLQAGVSVAVFLGNGDGTFNSRGANTSPNSETLVPPSITFGSGPAPGSILTQNLHGQSPTAGIPDIVLPDLSGGVTVLINKTK